MIKTAIKKYQMTSSTLGQGADNMEFGVGRSEFIKTYKASLAKQKKEVAEWLHNNYEEIAKGENWDTQKICKVDFDSLPKENQNVMLELAKRILSSS